MVLEADDDPRIHPCDHLPKLVEFERLVLLGAVHDVPMYMLVTGYNFILRNGAPHMRIFTRPCPFAYGVSPYAYSDRF
jgi:hypothetical protein